MSSQESETNEIPSALPSPGARILAFISIAVAGVCGALIGWKVTDLTVEKAGSLAILGGVITALAASIGVGVVAVLVLRAMSEWTQIQENQNGPKYQGR